MTHVPHSVDTLAIRVIELERRVYERFALLDKALQLQAFEYDRRLEALNGEAGRLAVMQAHYVPREVFEAKIVELDKVTRVLQDYRSNLEGRIYGGMAVVGIVITLISLGLRFIGQ